MTILSEVSVRIASRIETDYPLSAAPILAGNAENLDALPISFWIVIPCPETDNILV